MQVRNLMLYEYQKQWEENVSRLQLQNLQFYNDFGLDFENMEQAFTIDEVQVYVDNDIKNSELPDREDYHIKMLSKLARLYANTVFLMLRQELNRRSYILDKEAFYQKAIASLKNRYNNNTAYPCNDSNRQFMSAKEGGGGFFTGGNMSEEILSH